MLKDSIYLKKSLLKIVIVLNNDDNNPATRGANLMSRLGVPGVGGTIAMPPDIAMPTQQ